MQFTTAGLNNEGYNEITQAIHCSHAVLDADGNATADCEKALFDRYRTMLPHHFLVWEHYVGPDAAPQRIPNQTSAMFCATPACSPFMATDGTMLPVNDAKNRNCAKCGQVADRTLPRAEVDVIAVAANGDRTSVGHYRFHVMCLPANFDVVKAQHNTLRPTTTASTTTDSPQPVASTSASP